MHEIGIFNFNFEVFVSLICLINLFNNFYFKYLFITK